VKSAQRFAYTKLVNRSPDNGLDEDSALLIFQLRAIDKSRLKYKIGHLENNILIQVNDDLKRLLGL
jgi:mRNA interferase MazF